MPTFTGTTGDDVLTGTDGDDILIGLAGNDRLDGGTGRDTADYSAATSAVRVDLRISGPQDTGGAGIDTLISIESVTGSAFDDVLIGSDAFNVLIGGGGADILTGGPGTDIFRYLATSDSTATSQDIITDFLTASDAIDITALAPTQVRIVYAENFSSQVFAETATGTFQLLIQNIPIQGDSLFQFPTIGVQMFGSSRGDSLQGSGRDDQIFGGDGNDTLFGSRGADILTGGQGSDSFRYISALDSTAAASDTITDFEVGRDGIDLSLMLVTSIAIGRLDNGDSVLFAQGRDGALQVLFRNVALTTANIAYQGYGATGFQLIGSNNADVIVGTTFGDSIQGSGGDDILTGGTGADSIGGGTGRDTFRYAEGDSTQAAGMDNLYDFTTAEDRIDLTGVRVSSVSLVRMADGSSILFAGPGGSTVPAAVAVGATGRAINAGDLDYLPLVGSNVLAVTHSFGSAVADTLTGSARADSLYGLDGNDTLVGGGGADALAGGAGADTFVYNAASDSNGTGYDNLYDFETGIDRIDLRLMNATSISVIRTDNGSSFVFAETPGGAFQLAADHRLINGNDFLYSNGFGVYLVGSSNADVLTGTSQADTIQGGAGADTITGGGGADAISGGAGADNFVYLAASDSSQATGADNLYDFQTGMDKIDLTRLGATDVSIIRTENGSSFVFAHTTSGDFVTTADQRAINGIDLNYISNVGFYMRGSSVSDVLIGSAYGDVIDGGSGDDIITGGGGADVLTGGAGADIFRYSNVGDSYPQTIFLAGPDIINDFASGLDKVDLRALHTSASDTFGIAYSGANSFLFVDLGGNGTNDMLIQLSNTRLVTSDILWGTASGSDVEPEFKVAGPEVLPGEDTGGTDIVHTDLSGFAPYGGSFMLMAPDSLLPTFHGQDWYL